jgi:hypothetical protein
MLMRVLASTMAILGFAVVCLSGLLRGHSFASVVKGSLVALAVCGAVGFLAAWVIRVVVTEDFNRRHRGAEAQPPPAAPGAAQSGPGGDAAARTAPDRASRPAGSAGN